MRVQYPTIVGENTVTVPADANIIPVVGPVPFRLCSDPAGNLYAVLHFASKVPSTVQTSHRINRIVLFDGRGSSLYV